MSTPRHAAPSTPIAHVSAEHARLAESPGATDPWRLWGPYLAGRQWGTVREDYSADGDAWNNFPFDQSHARAYRWGEDGLGGVSDRFGFLNFAVALWNGKDDRLKERLFGLTNPQGNHGEDVKEYWWPLSATPTHSHARWVYRYPQAAFPYADLVETNARRSRAEAEYELTDTGVLDDDRFFDVEVEYAKLAPDDLCIRLTVTNCGPEAADLHLLPHLWFRNTWAWGRDDRRPNLRVLAETDLPGGDLWGVEAEHGFLGRYHLIAEASAGVRPDILVCDNETDAVALFGAAENPTAYPKDGINRRVVHGDASAVNPDGVGTKSALWYRFTAIPPQGSVTVRLRLSAAPPPERPLGAAWEAALADRNDEATEFYDSVIPAGTSAEDRSIAERAFAGLLWGKQTYRYSVDDWLAGDPAQPPSPPERLTGRNASWGHLSLADVISMPDEWEYPWFASWDLAFHCLSFAHIDPAFAKDQLVLLCREWAMHPNGQLPAYEWAFSDVNPPVHAWAAMRVYELDGSRDRAFLTRVFSKLLVNFAWWVNRKDADDSNLYEGGFLGMDNIGLFDRSAPLPPGHRLEQSDATSWMAFYCLSMLRIALELARTEPAFDDAATMFFEHFLRIAEAMSSFGSHGVSLWDEQDGFFYDVLVGDPAGPQSLRVRSLVGLLPLLSVAVAPEWVISELPDFTSRVRWMARRRPDLMRALSSVGGPDGIHLTVALVDQRRARRLLTRLLDEQEFLSPHGIRSLSASYREPFTTVVGGKQLTLTYEAGESDSGLFGGNSNWRGPVWFPINVLLADALRTNHGGRGHDVQIDFPTGSGQKHTLSEVAEEIDQRLIGLFRRGPDGLRPGDPRDVGTSERWRRHLTFSEYFNGDDGSGLGASHQTGWTALVAHLICNQGGASR